MMSVLTSKEDQLLKAPGHSHWCHLLRVLCLACALGGNYALADALDAAVSVDPLLGSVAQALAAYDIDVTTNLNAREVISQRSGRPRLGRFSDLPIDRLPTTDELLFWEAEYRAAQLGGLAILAVRTGADTSFALSDWLDADSGQRMFVTFHADDLPIVEKIKSVVDAYTFNSQLLIDPELVSVAGELYSTAAQRLALDTRTARRFDSEVTELTYLGERVRRDTDSLFKTENDVGNNRLARGEPAVFLKETLGDEFNQSTIREIVVPGGVALGETAQLQLTPASLRYNSGVLTLIDIDGRQWTLPALAPEALKALFDFVSRSEAISSDAIVDIDGEGRVRIAGSLRDTDVGYALMEADSQPFGYVRNLAVTKSVIIDTAVDWFELAELDILQFETDFEVRFLSADNMRIAQTRVALEYSYDSMAASITYTDAWGRDAGRLHDNLDYIGLGKSVAVVANYAGWIGLFRALSEARVPFLHGRYEFMKLDKSGRSTPARF